MGPAYETSIFKLFIDLWVSQACILAVHLAQGRQNCGEGPAMAQDLTVAYRIDNSHFTLIKSLYTQVKV